MQTQQSEATEPTPPPRSKRTGIAIAAAAFVVVLLVVGIAALLSRGEADDVAPPSTTLNSTTTVAPTTTEAGEPQTAPSTTGTTLAPTATEPPEELEEGEEPVELPDYPVAYDFEVRTLAVIPDAAPASLAIGSDDAFYLADWNGSGEIFRVEADGTSEVWAESDLLGEAYDVAFGPDGRLYVTSFTNGRLVAFDETGTAELVTDQLLEPTGMVFAPDGALLVADRGSASIVEVKDDGSVEEFVRYRSFAWPTHMTFDEDGNLYVVNFLNGRLMAVAPSGEVTELHDFPGALIGLVYRDGVLYVVDLDLSLIYRYTLADGTVEILAGTGRNERIDGVGAEASLNWPDAIIVGPDDEFYFVQYSGDDGIALSVLTPVN